MSRPGPLPKWCECGGRLVHTHAMGRTFTYCNRCTPKVRVRVPARVATDQRPKEPKP